MRERVSERETLPVLDKLVTSNGWRSEWPRASVADDAESPKEAFAISLAQHLP